MRKYLALGLMCSTATSYGLQTGVAEFGKTLAFDISLNELTRISVADKRIKDFLTSKDALAIKADENGKYLIIKPNTASRDPIEGFLELENAEPISIRLSPKQMPLETIHIEAPDILGRPEGKLTHVQDRVIRLIQSIFNKDSRLIQETSLGAFEANKFNGLITTVIMSSRDGDLQGFEYEVKNPSTQVIQLLENDFFEPQVRAVMIVNKSLGPKETSRVLVVKGL